MTEMQVMEPAVTDWSIILGYRGSWAYGTQDKDSDKDLISVCVPPMRYYLGLETFGSQGTQEYHRDEWDIVCYEARKFFRVLMGGSIDALCALWLPEDRYMKVTEAGRVLINGRDDFLSRQLYFVARGMIGEHFKEYYKVTVDKHLNPGYVYKSKNAMQRVRVIRMVTETLLDGQVNVVRNDADELKAIKTGAWSIDRVNAEVQRLSILLNEAYVKSPLPEGLNIDFLGDKCVSVINMAWNELRGKRPARG